MNPLADKGNSSGNSVSTQYTDRRYSKLAPGAVRPGRERP